MPGPIRVLFVTANAGLQARAAALSGVDVVGCDSMIRLYTAVTKHAPHVVVVDADLPAMSIDSGGKFLRSKAETKALPVLLLLSARNGDDDDQSVLVQTVKPDDFVDRTADLAALRR